MRLFALPSQFYRVKDAVLLSKAARLRLRWLDFYFAHGRNASLTARRFGISRETVRRWVRRFDPRDLTTLEDGSRRPHRVRASATPDGVVRRIVELRRRHPAWSKYKLHALLAREGIFASASTIGRILKRYDLVRTRKKRYKRTKLERKRPPRALYRAHPGSLVQMDAKYVYPTPGVRWFQFTALDTCTRRRVMRLLSSLSSKSATRFLREAANELGFAIDTVQTDNGSEFLRYFHEALDELRIPHYFSRPHTPKDLAMLERSHKTDDDEFYSQTELPLDICEANALLKQWQLTYNSLRPHQALGYLTPNEKLNQYITKTGTPQTASYVMNQNNRLTRGGVITSLWKKNKTRGGET
mgnify:CR=1 FL=1